MQTEIGRQRLQDKGSASTSTSTKFRTRKGQDQDQQDRQKEGGAQSAWQSALG